MSAIRLLPVGILVVVLAACPAPAAVCGADDCADADAGEPSSDARDAGEPDAGGPAAGTLEGACLANGRCNGVLVCLSGRCATVPLPPDGSLAGACRSDGSCDGALQCAAGKCRQPVIPEGTEGGPCFGNGSCNSGLACHADVCFVVATEPAAHEEGGLCFGACFGELECWMGRCAKVANSLAGSNGGPCRDDLSCDADLVCIGGRCTVPRIGYFRGGCRSDFTCARGFACQAGRCLATRTGARGDIGGACYPNGTCNGTIACVSGTCIGAGFGSCGSTIDLTSTYGIYRGMLEHFSADPALSGGYCMPAPGLRDAVFSYRSELEARVLVRTNGAFSTIAPALAIRNACQGTDLRVCDSSSVRYAQPTGSTRYITLEASENQGAFEVVLQVDAALTYAADCAGAGWCAAAYACVGGICQ